MPFDGNTLIDHSVNPLGDQKTASAKLLYLADFMETLSLAQVNMKTVHHACGAAHCAWGWGEVIGLFPRAPESDEDDSRWADEMQSAEAGKSAILGLSFAQFRYCFGIGYQFRFLKRPYTPVDVARHLRETAAAITADKT